MNETNVKVLTKELVEYLKVSDPEFKGDLTAKISGLVQKYVTLFSTSILGCSICHLILDVQKLFVGSIYISFLC